jgi:hypothetical protein
MITVARTATYHAAQHSRSSNPLSVAEVNLTIPVLIRLGVSCPLVLNTSVVALLVTFLAGLLIVPASVIRTETFLTHYTIRFDHSVAVRVSLSV